MTSSNNTFSAQAKTSLDIITPLTGSSWGGTFSGTVALTGCSGAATGSRNGASCRGTNGEQRVGDVRLLSCVDTRLRERNLSAFPHRALLLNPATAHAVPNTRVFLLLTLQRVGHWTFLLPVRVRSKFAGFLQQSKDMRLRSTRNSGSRVEY